MPYDQSGEFHEPTNHDRAMWAMAAAVAYARDTRTLYTPRDLEPNEASREAIEEVVGDLFGDLCHYLGTVGINGAELFATARGRYEEEVEESLLIYYI